MVITFVCKKKDPFQRVQDPFFPPPKRRIFPFPRSPFSSRDISFHETRSEAGSRKASITERPKGEDKREKKREREREATKGKGWKAPTCPPWDAPPPVAPLFSITPGHDAIPVSLLVSNHRVTCPTAESTLLPRASPRFEPSKIHEPRRVPLLRADTL